MRLPSRLYADSDQRAGANHSRVEKTLPCSAIRYRIVIVVSFHQLG